MVVILFISMDTTVSEYSKYIIHNMQDIHYDRNKNKQRRINI